MAIAPTMKLTGKVKLIAASCSVLTRAMKNAPARLLVMMATMPSIIGSISEKIALLIGPSVSRARFPAAGFMRTYCCWNSAEASTSRRYSEKA